jgi:hypothetical protein
MHKQKSKLRERTQLFFIYGLMITAIAALLVVLVLVIQGYRYNRYDGKIEQGGLVQFNSVPSGATVAVDGIELANKTASKITLTSGSHTITMNRGGYNEWKKTATVVPGSVLWLNYARLFPTKPQTSAVTEYAAVSSAVQSRDGNWMAVVPNPTVAAISLVRLDSDTPSISPLDLPTSSYTAPVDGAAQRFTVTAWDKDSQSVLIRHEFDGRTEFIVLNARGDGTAYNVSARLGVVASKVEFSENDNKVLYLLNDSHELRRANISSTTVSGPLVANVSDFTAAGQTIITYETFADVAGKRSVGYVSPGSNAVKQIASYDLANDVPLHARAGVYYGDRYLAIAHGLSIDVTTGSLPSSDSDATLSRKTVAQLTTSAAIAYLGFSPVDNRMVYAQSGDKVITYDLELDSTATTTFAAAPTSAVTWIDEFHMATTVNARASYYDFDGTNGQLVASSAVDLPLAVSSNDKYLYYFATSDKGISLMRIRMTD